MTKSKLTLYIYRTPHIAWNVKTIALVKTYFDFDCGNTLTENIDFKIFNLGLSQGL